MLTDVHWDNVDNKIVIFHERVYEQISVEKIGCQSFIGLVGTCSELFPAWVLRSVGFLLL